MAEIIRRRLKGVRQDDVNSHGLRVVVCDRLFEQVLEASCGGPAEAAAGFGAPPWAPVVDAFSASPRTFDGG